MLTHARLDLSTYSRLLTRDDGWAAAHVVLDSPDFDRDGRVWSHVDTDDGTIHFDAMFARAEFAGGMRKLLDAAQSLYNGSEHLILDGLVCSLSASQLEVLVAAMRVRHRGGSKLRIRRPVRRLTDGQLSFYRGDDQDDED